MKTNCSWAIGLWMMYALSAPAQTNSIWHRQAFGQTMNCPSRPGATYGWPNNNNWSQAQIIGDPCSEGDLLVQQPSNWSTPEAPNGIGYNVVLGSLGGAPANLDLTVALNKLTVQSDGGLNMQWGTSLTASTIELQGDNGITYGGGGGGWPAIYLSGGGLLLKSGGTGSNAMSCPFYHSGGTVQVNSGILSLCGGGAGSNANFSISSGATLDLTGGSGPTCSGWMTGSGAGQVRLASGAISAAPSLTLNFPGALFQWTGGQFTGVTTNLNSLTIAGLGAAFVGGGFYNAGVVHQTNTATLAINWSSHFDNLPDGIYKFESDAGIGQGNCCGGNPVFNNFGLVRKSDGSGTSLLNVLFNNFNGALQVDSGTLSLAGGGNSSNGTFTVASGAALDLTGGNNPIWAGQMNGSGAGAVMLSRGTIGTSPSLTLNLPGALFQWSGGWLAGTTINSNVVSITGTNSVIVGGGFYNYGLVHHTGTATLGIRSSGLFNNEPGGTYNLEGDGNIAPGGGGGGNPAFQNSGLLRKSNGTGTSTFSLSFNNQNGSIEVDSGSLSLSGGGSDSNGTFIVASGAALDLTGGSNPTWTGQITGSGAGTVAFNSGSIGTSPNLTLNLPGGLFQWTGGQFAGTTINSNTLTIAGTGSMSISGGFYNYGLVHQTGSTTLAINWSSGLINELGGIYSLDGDVNVAIGGGGGGWPAFNNYGLVRKTSGTNTATFSCPFSNLGGAIEVDSGTLSIGDYAQGGGAFTTVLGGRGAGQTGRLSANGTSLNGPLNVRLANGFAPALGEQFQILSSSGLGGTFTSLNVPAGIAVTYSNNSVFLVVTGTVPAQIVNPALSGNHLSFAFGTVSNQSYTVQRNDDLDTAGWTFYTNLTGNGSLMQVFAPATNTPHRFFRVRQP